MKIAVFCGSSFGNNPLYKTLAQTLGKEIAKRGFHLVYGGSCVGLMGTIADAVLNEGGEVTGVITKNLSKKEHAHNSLTYLHIVDDILERKKMMEDLSDAFIIMPGGFGTMDELFEVLMYGQLGYHKKPCAVLNVNHFFDHLFKLLNQLTKEGFVKKEHNNMLLQCDNIDSLFNKIIQYVPPKPKWD